MKNFFKTILLFTILLSLPSCNDFLDEKPNKKLVVPNSMADLQAMLDDHENINIGLSIGEMGADDYYLTNIDWLGLSREEDRDIYTWKKDGIAGSFSATQWYRAYTNVYKANIIIESFDKMVIDSSNDEWRNIKGQALFLRARGFLEAVIIWSNTYDISTSKKELGIPLRLKADFNAVSKRATLEESYLQIINDLKGAIDLLPITPLHVYRASRPAALGLLARVYLFMRDYEKCLLNVEDCLDLKSSLLDFSTLDTNATFPIPEFNDEIIYQSLMSAPAISNSRAKIDSALFDSYDGYDLRKSIFFKTNNDDTRGFRGSYTSSSSLFSGITVGEMYLMRAECYARLNQIKDAIHDLNRLMVHRWKKIDGTSIFNEYTANNKEEVLNLVLRERRKELILRGIRWPDIKRLNKEGHDINLKRILNDKVFTLSANSGRFIMQIPDDVISLTGIERNER